MTNFDRQYRMTAGKPGSPGFEIGDTAPYTLRINFHIQKQGLMKGPGSNPPALCAAYSGNTLLNSIKHPSSTLTFATSSRP